MKFYKNGVVDIGSPFIEGESSTNLLNIKELIETETSGNSMYNILNNPNFEAISPLDENVTWDTELNKATHRADHWTTGFNSGVANPAVGYHAQLDNWTYPYNTLYGHYANNGNRWIGVSTQNGFIIKAGTTYTITCVYRSKKHIYPTIGIYHTKKGDTKRAFFDTQRTFQGGESKDEWVKVSRTITLDKDVDESKMGYLYIYFHDILIETNKTGGITDFEEGAEMWVRSIKLEESPVATSIKDLDFEMDYERKTGINLIKGSESFKVEEMNYAPGISGRRINKYVVRISANGTNESWAHNIGGTENNTAYLKKILTTGDYTITVRARRVTGATGEPKIHLTNVAGGYKNGNKEYTEDWQDISYHFYYPGTGVSNGIHIGFSDCLGDFEFSQWKLERGTSFTGWSMSPRDNGATYPSWVIITGARASINKNQQILLQGDISEVSPVIKDSLVLYYDFDYGTQGENVAYDYSGKNNNGQILVASAKADGVLFSGDDELKEFVEADNPLFYQNDTKDFKWTVSGVFKITTGIEDQALVSGLHHGMYLSWKDTGRMLLYINMGSDDYYIYGDSTYSRLIRNGKWHHITFVFNNKKNRREIYVNGEIADTRLNSEPALGPNLTSTPMPNEEKIKIGTGMNGTLKSFYMYDRDLSISEIKKNYEVWKNKMK